MINTLHQRWANSGPGATCGPPSHFIWPAEPFCRKITFKKCHSQLALLKWPPNTCGFEMNQGYCTHLITYHYTQQGKTQQVMSVYIRGTQLKVTEGQFFHIPPNWPSVTFTGRNVAFYTGNVAFYWDECGQTGPL